MEYQSSIFRQVMNQQQGQQQQSQHQYPYQPISQQQQYSTSPQHQPYGNNYYNGHGNNSSNNNIQNGYSYTGGSINYNSNNNNNNNNNNNGSYSSYPTNSNSNNSSSTNSFLQHYQNTTNQLYGLNNQQQNYNHYPTISSSPQIIPNQNKKNYYPLTPNQPSSPAQIQAPKVYSFSSISREISGANTNSSPSSPIYTQQPQQQPINNRYSMGFTGFTTSPPLPNQDNSNNNNYNVYSNNSGNSNNINGNSFSNQQNYSPGVNGILNFKYIPKEKELVHNAFANSNGYNYDDSDTKNTVPPVYPPSQPINYIDNNYINNNNNNSNSNNKNSNNSFNNNSNNNKPINTIESNPFIINDHQQKIKEDSNSFLVPGAPASQTQALHNKTHKRFYSTSSIQVPNSTSNSISNSSSTSSSNLLSLSSSNNGKPSTTPTPSTTPVSQSPLKSKFLKVVSDVKKGLPQVGDQLLTQYNNLSLSLSNGGVNKRSDTSSNPDISSPQLVNSTNSFAKNASNKQNNNNTPSIQKSEDFYTYYGSVDSNDSSNNNDTLNNNSNINDTKVDNSTSDLSDNENDIKSGKISSLISEFEDLGHIGGNNNNNSPLKTSSEAITIPPPRNDYKFKSNMLNQIKDNQQQQQQSPNRLRPVSSTYPNITTSGLLSSSPPNNNGSNEYPSLSNNTPVKVYKEDITLQRFKPLPPRPSALGSTSPTNSNSSNNNNNEAKGINSYTKSFLNMLASTIGNSNNDEDIEISGPNGASSERYREDFSQYLSEFGDKYKVYQHIHWHLEQNIVSIETIKLLGCNYGFSDQSRATSWMLLLGYLPINSSQRTSVLLHKRSQYRDLVKRHLPGQDKNLTFVFKQISTASASASSSNNNNNGNNNNDSVFSSSWDDNNSYYQQFNQHFKNPSSKLFSSMVNLVNINKAKNHEELVQQVHVDVIRTRPDGFVPLFETPEIEKMLERILMIWSIENPDISYFQGLNDLVCPFLLVFLEHEVNQLNHSNNSSYPSISQLLEQTSSPLSQSTINNGNKSNWSVKLEKLLGEGLILKELKECGQAEVVLSRVEADVYWCISLLMNTVKHYAQGTGCGLPAEGMMRRLEALVRESNDELYKHLKNNDIDFSHFSFRWMVCFLTRDFDLETGVKLWDHYFCDRENQGFSLLHICFCSSLLTQWTPDLLTKDFMELVQYLQKPPSLKWNSNNLESIFRKSYLLKEKYKNILL